jgi:YegS/Rv2252/BmrU family lipid kinase
LKTFFVVNPQSASGRTGKRWLETNAKLVRGIGQTEHAFTTCPNDAIELTRRALRDGFDCVVAVGGDGTINEVVNGFFERGQPVNGHAAMAVLPLGTGGDFRRSFGWTPNLEHAIERLKGESTIQLDVGLLEYENHEGQTATRFFVNVCSLGVGGLVDQEVGRSKWLGGKLGFMFASMKALVKYSDQTVTFSADAGAPERTQITALSVANGKYFGGGMCVAPEAVPSDGVFDVTVWQGFGFSDFLLKSKALYSGSHVNLSGTRVFKCRSLEASSDQQVLLDVDGEQLGRLPCKIKILPGAIRLKT